ncbi:unnamed protein product [Brachionus calyciflorus]|uniref:Outer dynein arm-docking complex subunit 4 n=1 Tax=Brachionus calyciflorus TaxID=104777 RepID=A0A814FV53_9BILA|nr:unnamed protein product [Brachionus calyciflorus]
MPISKRKQKDDEQSVTSESKLPVKNVPALMGEGEKFFRDQLYDRAIQCYTEALELSPGNMNALVERAACYLKTGKNDLALNDAEESLKENKEFTKGLYQKAEALYAMGEFELALVFYHRGKKLRGDVREFQLGINKAQEAIDNCVGDPDLVKLEVKGDLSYFDKPDEMNIGYQKPYAQKQQAVQKREKRALKPGSQKTIKQLLGELYADKVYLENLLNDDHATRVNTKAGDAIWLLANNGLNFLDSRTEFWRQQKPIYARKAVRQSNSSIKNPLNYVLNQLEIIDNLQSAGKHAESLDKSNRLMVYVNKSPDSQLTDKKSIISNIHSSIGNAYLEMGKYELALQNHQKDLEISKDSDNKEGISRAYENLGRVYARNGKYKSAIDIWEKKLPLAESDMEKAWLYHEIGRCHLELGNYKLAEEYGEKSLEHSEKISDEVWKLNATILMGQSQAKMGDEENLKMSIDNFEKAAEMTEKQKDEPARKAVRKALAECKEKLRKLQVASVKDVDEKEDQNENKQEEKIPSEKNSPRESNKKDETPRKTNDSPKNIIDTPRSNKEKTPEPKNETPRSNKEKTPEPKNETPRSNKEKSPEPKSETPRSIKEKSPEPKNDTPRSIKEKSPEPINDTPRSQVSEKKPSKMEYKIQVKTSDDLSSGIDANVFITLIGTQDELRDIQLKQTNNDSNPFERDHVDNFDFDDLNYIGKLKKIVIGHDAPDSSWKLEFVNVTYDNTLYRFDVNKWLDSDFKKEDEKLASVELEPSSIIENVNYYEVEVKTCDDLSAGTDAKVMLDIYGSSGELLDVQLKNPSNNEDPFERNAINKFELNLKNIGKIQKLAVMTDGSGSGSSWKLAYIKIFDSKYIYTFTANKWIDSKTELLLDGEPVQANSL